MIIIGCGLVVFYVLEKMVFIAFRVLNIFSTLKNRFAPLARTFYDANIVAGRK